MYATHQKMLVLCVTFMSRETQRVAGVCLDDIVINRLPTCNIMAAGSAPPQPSPFSGGFYGKGGGGGGIDGGYGGGGRSGLRDGGEQQGNNTRLLLWKVVQ